MPPKQKNSKKKAKRAELVIADPTLRKFDVLDYVAKNIGRELITFRRCAPVMETHSCSDQFEVSASFSGIPFAIIGCKGVGPNDKVAEDNAAYNFITFFENYSLPDECLPNIRRNWIRAEADVMHLINVCTILIEELRSPEYSQVLWAPSDQHFTPSTDRLSAKQLKTNVKRRLEGLKNGPSTLKRKCVDVVKTTSCDGLANEEPSSKKTKMSDSPEKNILDDDDMIICLDDSTDDEPVINVSVDATPDNTISAMANLPENVPFSSIQLLSEVKDGTIANLTSPRECEYYLIGVEYSGDPQIEKTIKNYVARYRTACATLSDDVWKHHSVNGQGPDIYAWKMKVRAVLLDEIQTAFPTRKLQMYAVGSTVNGCGSYNSDMDLCLCIPDEGTSDVFSDARNIAVKYLKKVVATMYSNKKLRQVVAKAKLITAKVPIIKVDMRPPYSELDLDINVNNVPGIYNSHLIHYYSQSDARFPALALLIKHWAISNGISDALNGTFNSYSLILLLIHYLQCGVTPAVLPNLQFLLPERFSDQQPPDGLALHGELEGIPDRPLNPASIGELLMGFYHYYAQFDFQTWAISVRNARKFSRRDLPADTNHFGMYIEEPFDGKNTARCIREMDVINSYFRKASRHFKTDKPDLKKIKVSV